MLAHGVERGAALDQLLGVGGGRHHGGHGIGSAVFADAGRIAVAVAHIFAVPGIGRVLVDASHFQAARVGQHGMEVSGADLDRAAGLERVQRRFVGVAVQSVHAHAIPAAHFQPDIGAFALVRIQARLNGLLEHLAGHRLVFQVAQGHGATAIPRMHVCIDEARHQHAAGQIDQLCLLADVRRNPCITAHINDFSARDGDRLLHRVLTVDGVDITVAQHHVGAGRTLGLTPHQRHAGNGCGRGNGDK
ncbi:hypothetical protein D3C86_1506970 [compost metagenome]